MGWFVSTENGIEPVLLQEANFSVTKFGEFVNWTSSSFDLPENNSDGNQFRYTFDIWVQVSGDLDAAPATIKTSITEYGFDKFYIYWHWDFPWIPMGITVIGTISGIAVVSRVRKRRKCDCIGQPGCECTA